MLAWLIGALRGRFYYRSIEPMFTEIRHAILTEWLARHGIDCRALQLVAVSPEGHDDVYCVLRRPRRDLQALSR